MIPRLHIDFTLRNQLAFWMGEKYRPSINEYLLNHARTGIAMALHSVLPDGGKVGVVAYNCHAVANAVVDAGCTPVFVDVTDHLYIDLQHLATLSLDAIIVTNLFGLRNDIQAIRQIVGQTAIIVDNAHGYGLAPEGDFCVYSIGQGKFPSLGEGGVLFVNNPEYIPSIEQQYAQLSTYSFLHEIKLYLIMLIKAIMHIPCIYGLVTKRLKAQRPEIICREQLTLRRAAKGVSRMYHNAVNETSTQITQQLSIARYLSQQLQNHPLIQDLWFSDNAFMLIAQTNDVQALNNYFAEQGIETATHFAKTIQWATQFGYQQGSCPIAEQLTNQLVMIPTYKKIKI